MPVLGALQLLKLQYNKIDKNLDIKYCCIVRACKKGLSKKGLIQLRKGKKDNLYLIIYQSFK